MFALKPDQIKITDKASEHFLKHIKGTEGAIGMRLSLKNAGCGGFEYQLDIIDSEDSADDKIEYESGLNLFLPKLDSWRFLNMEIDYQTDSTGSRVIYKNPNEAGQCGCGLSVNFDQK